MIVNRINDYLSGPGAKVPPLIAIAVGNLAEHSFNRQFGETQEKQKTIRLSSIGRCIRQQAYNVLGVEENGKQIDSRARMIFFAGDMAEIAIVQVAKLAGCDIIDCGADQKTIVLDGIEGHPDGIYNDYPHSNLSYLLEVKSMSSFSFKDFERGILQEGYQYQINAYMEALGLSQAIVVALNKDAGVLAEMIVSKDAAVVSDIKKRISFLKNVKADKLPERPFGPNEKGHLPWNCLYCGHWKTCWPKAEKILVSNKYKLSVKEN